VEPQDNGGKERPPSAHALILTVFIGQRAGHVASFSVFLFLRLHKRDPALENAGTAFAGSCRSQEGAHV
jgi:hypothetical protein